MSPAKSYPLDWTTQTQVVGVAVQDHRRLEMVVQFVALGDWQVAALVTSIGETMEDHSYRIVGLYRTPIEAIHVAEGFAVEWLHDPSDTDRCPQPEHAP